MARGGRDADLTGVPAEALLPAPALVGRRAEVAALYAAIKRPPTLVVVEGEAGVGKSRLVEEVLARLPRGAALLGQCHPLREPLPLGAILDALRHLTGLRADTLPPIAGVLRPLLPELAAGLPPEPPALRDPAGQRHRLFRAVAEVLERAGPRVLVVEDLHWADPTTLDLLRFLVSRRLERVSLVISARTNAGAAVHELAGVIPASARFERVHVPPLAAADCGALAAGILGCERVSDEFATYLHEKTGGLPFAIEELLRLMLDRRDLRRVGMQWERRHLDEVDVPPLLRESILARVQGLSGMGQRIVHAAAVAEVPATDEFLLAIAELDVEAGLEALHEVLRSALLMHDGGQYRFRHALGLQAVAESMDPPLRRLLHRRAAAYLAALPDAPLGQLAHHHRGAGDVRAWAGYAEQAADAAIARFDHAAAVDLLNPVVQQPSLEASERARLAGKLGDSALHGRRRRAGVVQTLEALLAEAVVADRVEEAGLRVRLALLYLEAGRGEESRAHLRAALALVEDRPAMAARILIYGADVDGGTHRPFTEDLADHDRSVSLAARGGDRFVEVMAELDRSYALTATGVLGAWETADALPWSDYVDCSERSVIRAEVNLIESALFLGHYARGAELLDRSRARSERIGYQRFGDYFITLQAAFDWLSGRWEAAAAVADWLSTAHEDAPVLALVARLVHGLVLAGTGDPAATTVLAGVAEGARATPRVRLWLSAAGWLATVRGDEGRHAEALAALEPALRAVRAKGVWSWTGDVLAPAVRGLLAEGRTQQAADLVAEVDAGLTGFDSPCAHAALLTAKGLVAAQRGDQPGARDHLAAAGAAWRAIPRPYDAARADEALGGALAAAGETGAEPLLLDAFRWFKGAGATRDANRLRRTLREAGIAVPYRRGPRGYGQELSPREREVALLVAEGKTNREVAQLLFLSPWTVSHHAANAARKLGAASRTELARMLRPQ